jgi:hypothetical protein
MRKYKFLSYIKMLKSSARAGVAFLITTTAGGGGTKEELLGLLKSLW